MTNTARRHAFLLTTVFALLAGCASVAVTEDALEKNTAFALGLEPGSFTISDRQDDGFKTSYRVGARNGRRFSCYVTGSLSMLGRTVSDAVCSESGRTSTGPANAASPATRSTPCNALLKAAGRC